jgi:hypothetical protein
VAKSEVVFKPDKCSRLVRRVCMCAHVNAFINMHAFINIHARLTSPRIPPPTHTQKHTYTTFRSRTHDQKHIGRRASRFKIATPWRQSFMIQRCRATSPFLTILNERDTPKELFFNTRCMCQCV